MSSIISIVGAISASTRQPDRRSDLPCELCMENYYSVTNEFEQVGEDIHLAKEVEAHREKKIVSSLVRDDGDRRTLSSKLLYTVKALVEKATIHWPSKSRTHG